MSYFQEKLFWVATYSVLISLNIQLGALFVATLGSPVAEATAEAAPTADADAEADPHYFYYGKRWCLPTPFGLSKLKRVTTTILGHHGLGYAGYYGYPYGYGYGYYGHPYAYWGRKKREATPTATAEADPHYGYYGYRYGYYPYYGYWGRKKR